LCIGFFGKRHSKHAFRESRLDLIGIKLSGTWKLRSKRISPRENTGRAEAFFTKPIDFGMVRSEIASA
jgi:hypothetical protein